MSSNTTLSVVLIDNDTKVSKYIRQELEKYYSKVNIFQVFDADKLFKLLGKKQYDVVVTEHELGWIDGLTVLEYVKNIDPYCPVILFTSQLSYHVFEKGIKKGLDDYVFKFPYASQRLITSIRICLQNAHNLRQAKEAMKLYETLFNSVPIALCMFSEEEEIIEVNNTFLTLFKYGSLEEIKKKPVKSFFVNPEDLEKLKTKVTQQIKETSNIPLFKSDGTKFSAEIQSVSIKDPMTNDLKIIFSIRDVTEKMHAETLKKKAFLKIEKIILKNAEIIDRLRNKLSVISLLNEISANGNQDKIMQKVEEIDELLNQMNEQIKVSLKIREFIGKYF